MQSSLSLSLSDFFAQHFCRIEMGGGHSCLQRLVYKNKLEEFWWKHLNGRKHLHLIEIIVFQESGLLCCLSPLSSKNTFTCTHSQRQTHRLSAHILMERPPERSPGTSSSSSGHSHCSWRQLPTQSMLGGLYHPGDKPPLHRHGLISPVVLLQGLFKNILTHCVEMHGRVRCTRICWYLIDRI